VLALVVVVVLLFVVNTFLEILELLALWIKMLLVVVFVIVDVPMYVIASDVIAAAGVVCEVGTDSGAGSGACVVDDCNADVGDVADVVKNGSVVLGRVVVIFQGVLVFVVIMLEVWNTAALVVFVEVVLPRTAAFVALVVIADAVIFVIVAFDLFVVALVVAFVDVTIIVVLARLVITAL